MTFVSGVKYKVNIKQVEETEKGLLNEDLRVFRAVLKLGFAPDSSRSKLVSIGNTIRVEQR